MIAMFRQSLDSSTGAPADIGHDARRLWHAAPGLPAAGHGHRLGAGGGGGGEAALAAARPVRGGAGAAGLLDGAGEAGDIDAA
jgi:hypothetical protein